MRKIILCLLIAICAVCGAVGFAACVPEGLQPHNWSEEWNSDKETHWHDCLDQGCYAKGSRADHEWVLTDDIQIEPTCGESGIGTYRCAVCGATVQNREIPPTEQHDWHEAGDKVEPTCNKDGSQIYACGVCGAVKTETIPATGAHNYDNRWHSDKEGHWHVCTNEGCGEKSDLIPHEAGDPVTVQPLGWNDGSEYVPCKECGYKMSSKAIEPSGMPVSFEVTFKKGKIDGYPSSDDGKLFPVEKDEDGVYHVNLPARPQIGEGGKYNFECVNFKDSEGNVIAKNEAGLLNRARIVPYWRNPYNSMDEKKLDLQTPNISMSLYGSINVNASGLQKLVFKFITGSGSTEKVRFEVVINVNG